MPVVALLVAFTLYCILGPLLLLIAIRIFLWLGQAFQLANALGVFVAETRRSFLAHARALDREFGTSTNARTE
jgi:hypothetical protein